MKSRSLHVLASSATAKQFMSQLRQINPTWTPLETAAYTQDNLTRHKLLKRNVETKAESKGSGTIISEDSNVSLLLSAGLKQ